MKIVWNYIFILTGLSLLLQISGINNGFLSFLFTMLGISFTSNGITLLPSSPFALTILGILGLATVAGVKIGIFGGGSVENYLIAPLVVSSLILYVSMIVSLINLPNNGWVGIVTGVLLAPFAIGLLYSFADWLRGGDF